MKAYGLIISFFKRAIPSWDFTQTGSTLSKVLII